MRKLLPAAVVSLLSASIASAGVGIWTTNSPNGVGGVITDVQTPGIVYTASDTVLYRSIDSGESWTPTSPLPNSGFDALASGPQTTVYAEGPYTAANFSQVAIFSSHDQGGHWSQLAVGDFGTSYLLALDPVTPTTVYLVTNFYHGGPYASGSLQRSTDGGLTWTYIGAGLAEIVNIAVAPSPPSSLYAIAVPFPTGSGGLVGLARSLDSGVTWSLRNASFQGGVSTLVVDPTNSSVIYAATGSAGVLKSTDGGVTFAPVNSGLPHVNVVSLCIDPLRPNRLYATTATPSLGQSDGVFTSTDGGASWNAMNNGLPASDVATLYSLAIDASGAYLHASTASGIFDYEITDLPCASDTHTLCLNNGRFSVTADFQTTPTGPSSPATAVPLTSNTGYFWFFDPANIELVTKVLDGCSVNGGYWFFASGLTNVGVQISVTDTVTGATKPYSNTFGTPFQPIQDTSAFPCP